MCDQQRLRPANNYYFQQFIIFVVIKEQYTIYYFLLDHRFLYLETYLYDEYMQSDQSLC